MPVQDYEIDENNSNTIIRDPQNGIEIEVLRESLGGRLTITIMPLEVEDD